MKKTPFILLMLNKFLFSMENLEEIRKEENKGALKKVLGKKARCEVRMQEIKTSLEESHLTIDTEILQLYGINLSNIKDTEKRNEILTVVHHACTLKESTKEEKNKWLEEQCKNVSLGEYQADLNEVLKYMIGLTNIKTD